MLPLIVDDSSNFQKRLHLACPAHIIEELARTSQFMQRSFRKISPLTFLQGIICGTTTAFPSLNLIAATMAAITGMRISKQAVEKRLGQEAVSFLRRVLKHVIAYPLAIHGKHIDPFWNQFSEVWLFDSTNIKLHSSLIDFFPGSRNQTQKQSAILKIQLGYELLSGSLDGFLISPYTRNDQKAAHDVFAVAKKQALIIRDLGYFTLSSLKKMIDESIFFVSRLSPNITILDLDGNRLDLLAILKKHGHIDRMVLLGAKEQIEVRLVATALDEAKTKQRKIKAEHDRSAKANHSDQYMELLGWAVFVTNVPISMMPPSIIYPIYSVRWKIEIIFKIWKSFFEIIQIPKASVHYVQVLVYAKLILIVLTNQTYILCNNAVGQKNNAQISSMKFAQFMRHPLFSIAPKINRKQWRFTLLEFLEYYCSYEKRRQRRNMNELIAAITP